MLASGVAALAACAGPAELGGNPKLEVLAGNQLPMPGRTDVQSSTTPYYVGPFDRLVIDVFGIEELSAREVQVDASGRISFPLAGTVNVSGMTPVEIEGELSRLLAAQYIRNPQVTVNLKETLSRVVTVEGQVKKPGLYPVVGRMTLMRAIATAEGTSEYSQLDDIVVFRTVDGQDYAALYNLDAIRHGAYPDPDIFAGDVVMVGESRGRLLFKDVLATAPALLTPLVIAIDRFTR
ncbi:polysaccharide biosynthesis/export family protein [Novosphingobium album (ex Liu et al. 2023)]|uniref:polysaccharide biosynthesis/export family protein n=1 Tax=Novosphingobium album (ex Liu et al. 2023) TaxID=3031130 RepID=UPI0023AF9F45|nr:polysaccharide biosynthesis/export family protein [Novosphingobium album (ex Liu et al. 2023)]